MRELKFHIPEDELHRVASAFCEIAGHAECGSEACLLEQVGKVVVGRVTAYERQRAARLAQELIPPLILNPLFTEEEE